MKPIIVTACLALLLSCSQKGIEQKVTLFNVKDFTAEVEGKSTSLYTLKSGP